MKRNKQHLKYLYITLLGVFLAACVNETEITEPTPKSYAISISLQDNNKTRASDVIEAEKIKRYDIFIYQTGVDGELVKYISGTPASGAENFTESFLATTKFETDKDIFVVANYDFEGKDQTQLQAITKAQLKAITFTVTQHAAGVFTEMTSFGGYKKSSTENEPFVMSVSRTGYNFSTAISTTLPMQLQRAYAKVVLQFKTTLTAANDADWIELKTVRVREINNIPTVARLLCDDGSSYTPTTQSYLYKPGSEYTIPAINTDLTQGNYVFDPFDGNRLALRIFPHAPQNVGKATSLLIDFEVGPTGENSITKIFKRLITIGDENYQIDPNYAYVITIHYGKTTNSITTDLQVIPWNLMYWEEDVDPN